MKTRFAAMVENTTGLGTVLAVSDKFLTTMGARQAQMDCAWRLMGREGAWDRTTREGLCLALTVCGWEHSTYKKLAPLLHREGDGPHSVEEEDDVLLCGMCMETMSTSILSEESAAAFRERDILFHPLESHLV